MKRLFNSDRLSSQWSIVRQDQKDCLLYTVNWSPWGFLHPWIINRKVPSESGIFQLWARNLKRFDMLVSRASYYGGVRNSLREITDELVPSQRSTRELLAEREVWFRFSVTSSYEQLYHLRDWLEGTGEFFNSQGKEILVNEVDSQSKFPLPPQDLIRKKDDVTRAADFGPPLMRPKGDQI